MIYLLTSIILAWLAVIFTVLSAVLYIVKRSGNKQLRKAFSRIHITVGVLLIVTGILHGILAGNMADATLGDMMVAPVLFTLNWGTLSLIAAVLLAVSYILRKVLKKRWMGLHRVLTVALIALVVLHVSDVGIQLLDRLQPVSYAEAAATNTTAQTEDDNLVTSAYLTASTSGVTTESTSTDTATLVEEANGLFSGVVLTDGVYQGSAKGYNGDITVSVTVSGGLVTDITIVNECDTPSYFRRAETVVDTIIEEQSLEVDAVSGATYSSAGIVNAVSAALSTAAQDGELAATEFTNSQSKHGRHGH